MAKTARMLGYWGPIRQSFRVARTWDWLLMTAQKEVESVLDSLPEEIRGRLDRCPIVLEPSPGGAELSDELPDDLLGIFEGDALGEGGSVLPPRIVLWLENIYDYAGHDPLTYREEVQTTLLHEIGHFLGWGEEDLDLRDLG